MGADAGGRERGGRDHGLKETAESIVIALVLAFVFRAYVVEAFVIPTGSMAPTLLGAHHPVRCKQCGYEFAVDPASREQRRRSGGASAVCPMCHFPNEIPSRVPAPGDRILVLKFLYDWRGPRRWDPIVFKNPTKPEQNYIKRLVGLPNERLAIVRGNVYVSPLDPAGDRDAAWRIARKTRRPAVQRAVFQPVYDSRYVPLDGGSGTAARDRALGPDYRWRRPWVPERAERWRMGRDAYRLEAAQGTLAFSFERARHQQVEGQAYNQLKAQQLPPQPPREVRVAATVVARDEPVGVTLSVTGRFGAPPGGERRRLRARIEPGGAARIAVGERDSGEPRVVARGRAAPLSSGSAARVELWIVDHAAILWCRGERVATWRYEIGLDELLARPRPTGYPELRLHVDGRAALHRVRVDRDIVYTAVNTRGERARGALVRGANGRRRGEPVKLGPDQFFCLGDNSPMSKDGRFWEKTDRWVEARTGAPAGRVPRSLLIGRAFFVYFPPVHRLSPDHQWGVPNFGDMRMID